MARGLLKASFAEPPLTIEGVTHSALFDRLVMAGISGGAGYDALIGVTAARHGAVLLTRDSRAVRVYAALDVPYDLIRS